VTDDEFEEVNDLFMQDPRAWALKMARRILQDMQEVNDLEAMWKINDPS
jgi:hypothetical protein